MNASQKHRLLRLLEEAVAILKHPDGNYDPPTPLATPLATPATQNADDWRTMQKWNRDGYRVVKGATSTMIDGERMFHAGQVVIKGSYGYRPGSKQPLFNGDGPSL